MEKHDKDDPIGGFYSFTVYVHNEYGAGKEKKGSIWNSMILNFTEMLYK